MNEIEETLLIIFLEDMGLLYESSFRWFKILKSGYHTEWEQFKKEELGRTLPEEFFFYTDDLGINFLNEGHHNLNLVIHLEKRSYAKNKIKITVVEDE